MATFVIPSNPTNLLAQKVFGWYLPYQWHSTFPVILDTGGMITISPNHDDFDPGYTPTEGDVLQGLAIHLQIEDTGTIQWALHLDDGLEVALSLLAYHVPSAHHVYSVCNTSFHTQRTDNILSSKHKCAPFHHI